MIPDDIMATAKAVYNEMGTTWVEMCYSFFEKWSNEDAELIAKAILAERNRCIAVAQNHIGVGGDTGEVISLIIHEIKEPAI